MGFFTDLKVWLRSFIWVKVDFKAWVLRRRLSYRWRARLIGYPIVFYLISFFHKDRYDLIPAGYHYWELIYPSKLILYCWVGLSIFVALKAILLTIFPRWILPIFFFFSYPNWFYTEFSWLWHKWWYHIEIPYFRAPVILYNFNHYLFLILAGAVIYVFFNETVLYRHYFYKKSRRETWWEYTKEVLSDYRFDYLKKYYRFGKGYQHPSRVLMLRYYRFSRWYLRQWYNYEREEEFDYYEWLSEEAWDRIRRIYQAWAFGWYIGMSFIWSVFRIIFLPLVAFCWPFLFVARLLRVREVFYAITFPPFSLFLTIISRPINYVGGWIYPVVVDYWAWVYHGWYWFWAGLFYLGQRKVWDMEMHDNIKSNDDIWWDLETKKIPRWKGRRRRFRYLLRPWFKISVTWRYSIPVYYFFTGPLQVFYLVFSRLAAVFVRPSLQAVLAVPLFFFVVLRSSRVYLSYCFWKGFVLDRLRYLVFAVRYKRFKFWYDWLEDDFPLLVDPYLRKLVPYLLPVCRLVIFPLFSHLLLVWSLLVFYQSVFMGWLTIVFNRWGAYSPKWFAHWFVRPEIDYRFGFLLWYARASLVPILIVFLLSPLGRLSLRLIPDFYNYTEAVLLAIAVLFFYFTSAKFRVWAWWDLREAAMLNTIYMGCFWSALHTPPTWIPGVVKKFFISSVKILLLYVIYPVGCYVLANFIYPLLEIYAGLLCVPLVWAFSTVFAFISVVSSTSYTIMVFLFPTFPDLFPFLIDRFLVLVQYSFYPVELFRVTCLVPLLSLLVYTYKYYWKIWGHWVYGPYSQLKLLVMIFMVASMDPRIPIDVPRVWWFF